LLWHQIELVASLGATTVIFYREVENTEFWGWLLANVSSEQETSGEPSAQGPY